MLRGTAAVATVMLSDRIAVSWFGTVESVTFTVKLKAPKTVGVPEIVPVDAFKFRPGGSEPELMDHM
jgi:hypothetical protein